VWLGNTLEEGEARREDAADDLIVVSGSLVKENRTAEVRTNGTAGIAEPVVAILHQAGHSERAANSRRGRIDAVTRRFEQLYRRL